MGDDVRALLRMGLPRGIERFVDVGAWDLMTAITARMLRDSRGLRWVGCVVRHGRGGLALVVLARAATLAGRCGECMRWRAVGWLLIAGERARVEVCAT
jgi:hypothetical protein